MSYQTIKADWIAVDWGTSHLRAWAMQNATKLDAAQSDQGMAKVHPNGFETALLDLVSDWLGDAPIDVVACGMVGARQGWVEAPYASIPAKPLSGVPVSVNGGDPRIRAHVVPGLKQNTPPDVMRGEETQIAGFLSLNTDWDGVICLPGTHTKWAHVSAGEVVSFQTFLTGEMFDTLCHHTVLQHSVSSDGWNDAAFCDAVSETISRPAGLAAQLFRLRAQDILEGQASNIARARLSGLLIGAELAAARPFWLGRQLAVVGADGVSKAYVQALAEQGAPSTLTDGTEMTIAGLTAAWRTLKVRT